MPPIGRRVLAVVAGVWLAAAALEAGQTPPAPSQQRPVFRTRTDLVQVDVVVVDKSGNHIRGLGQDDFTIADRGKPQALATFEEMSYPGAADVPPIVFPPSVKVDVATNARARDERLALILIDDLHIYRERTDRSKELARDVIGQIGAGTSMAVIFTSGDHSTQVTGDRAVLLDAVGTMKGRKSWRRPNDANDNQTPKPCDPEADTLDCLDQADKDQKVSLQEFDDNLTSYKVLQNAAKMLLADDARRKTFVFMSEGIAKDLTALFDTDLTPCEMTGVRCYHDTQLRQMMEGLRRASVAVYALDPRGRVSSQQLLHESFPGKAGIVATGKGSPGDEDSQFDWFNPVRQAQHGLEIAAAKSGGFAVTNTDDFAGGIRRIVEDLDHYYLIGFYPSDPTSAGFHALQVAVKGHPDWTLRARSGYMGGGTPPGPVNRDPLAALSSGVLPHADLPLRLLATPFPAGKAPARVDLSLEVTAPTDALTDTGGGLSDVVTYEVIVVDEKKQTATIRAGQEARVSLKAGPTSKGPAPGEVVFQIPFSVTLAPGKYQLRISATSRKAGKGGSVYLDADVPDFGKAPLALSGIVLGYAEGPRVPVGHPIRPPAGGPSPGVLPFEPSLDREFQAGEALRVYGEVARQNPLTSVRATVTILDRDDKPVSSVERQLPAGVGGRIDQQVSLAGLIPGPYRLHVAVTDGTASASRDVGLMVKR